METEPLLQKGEDSPQEGVEKSQIRNLFFGNMIVSIMVVGAMMYNSVLIQYVYKRVTEDMFRNQTLAGKGPVNQTCYLNTSDPDYILQEKAQQIAADKQMHFTILKSSLAIVSNIMLGSYSDSVGRKLLFATPLTGQCLKLGISAVIIYFNFDINWFFIPEGIDGITGGFFGFLIASYAFAADNTPATGARTMSIAFVEFFMNIAYAASATATGYFIQDVNFFYPTLTAMVIVLLDLILVVSLLPERKRSETAKRGKSNWITPLEGCRRVFGFYVSEGNVRKRICFVLGILIFFFTALPSVGTSNVETLFKLNLPFCWTPEKIGYFTTITTVAHQVIGVPLMRLLQYCCIDEVIGVINLLAVGTGEGLQSIASTDWMMYGVAGINIPGGTMFPIVRSILSRLAPANKQGSLFASIAVVETMCSLVGSSVFSDIYQYTVMIWRGMVFTVMGGTYVVGAIVLVIYIFVSKPFREKRDLLEVQRDVQQNQPGVPHVQHVVTVRQGTETDTTILPVTHAQSAAGQRVTEVTRTGIHVHVQSEFGKEDGHYISED